LREDRRTGDITSESLLPKITARARIIAKEGGVVAGIEELVTLFRLSNCIIRNPVPDGSEISTGTVICTVEGDVKDLLRTERVGLNILARMSGVATITRQFVDKARAVNENVKIAATRKTTPGFRYFEKKAVRIGGGDPHRYSLDDMVLIKENHIRACGGVTEILKLAGEKIPFSKKIDIEVETLDQFREALRFAPDIIMLDNMKPSEAKECREHLDKIMPTRSGRTLIEISGNITMENVADYAPYGDIISVGSLTHSYKSLDFTMLMDLQ
jgi:nicotinate-nucleotide pyrophosphorylase (carboxylating)